MKKMPKPTALTTKKYWAVRFIVEEAGSFESGRA